jgi:tetratricopeptide (TPR) repeat protein
MRSRALLLWALTALASCKKQDTLSVATDAGPGGTAAVRDSLGPPSQAELPTTDGGIFLDDLVGQIAFLESARAKNPSEGALARRLIPLLHSRSQLLGRVDDLERAAALADELVQHAPEDAASYLARASARSALHLFTAALADLDEAAKRRAKPAALASRRAVILEGQGDLDGALALRHAARLEDPDLTNLTHEASLLGQMGKTEEAVELFRKAVIDYRSVEPFPVAWLFLQEGLFWERAGDAARARSFYAAAHERIPAYGHAASHLATLVAPERAATLLAPIVAASDDPEFELVLASRIRAAGRAAEAEGRVAHVRARYNELVERHPEAYAEHAAGFLLDEGKEPRRVLALAKLNLAVRKTTNAYKLALLAALAAGEREEACTLGTEALKLPYPGGMLRDIAATTCR